MKKLLQIEEVEKTIVKVTQDILSGSLSGKVLETAEALLAQAKRELEILKNES